MNKKEGLKKTGEIIRPPVKDKGKNVWVVEYLENGKWVRHESITDDGAYMFYYQKLREFKEAITAVQMKEQGK